MAWLKKMAISEKSQGEPIFDLRNGTILWITADGIYCPDEKKKDIVNGGKFTKLGVPRRNFQKGQNRHGIRKPRISTSA